MNKLRYVIEWRTGIYDERDDTWFVLWNSWNREIFENDIEFKARQRLIQDKYENADDFEMRLYTCELNEIRE